MIRMPVVLTAVLLAAVVSTNFLAASDRAEILWMEGVVQLQRAAAKETSGEETEAVQTYLRALDVFVEIEKEFPQFEPERVTGRIKSLEDKVLAMGDSLPIRTNVAVQPAILTPRGWSRGELAAVLPVPSGWKPTRDPTGGVIYSIPLIETSETIAYQAFIDYVRKLQRRNTQRELLTLWTE